ncbi:hypothetical protein COOONC_25258, partial [Cooperia oncophora]
MSSAAPRPALDVAAIKRSVEAEQRAFEEKMPSRKPKRRVGSSKVQRKRPESSRSDKDSASAQQSPIAMKRGRSEAEQVRTPEEAAAPFENVMSTSPIETVSSPRRPVRAQGTDSEVVDEQSRRRRSSRQSIQEGEGDDHDQNVAVTASGVGSHHEVNAAELPGDANYAEATGGESDQPLDEGGDESQSWRRRAGRPPARAASAAAQSLLAAELAATDETPSCSPKRGVRSRSNTDDSPSSRPAKRRVGIQSDQGELFRPDQQYPLESPLLGDLELEPKDDSIDDDVIPIGDTTEFESISPRTTHRSRPMT